MGEWENVAMCLPRKSYEMVLNVAVVERSISVGCAGHQTRSPLGPHSQPVTAYAATSAVMRAGHCQMILWHHNWANLVRNHGIRMSRCVCLQRGTCVLKSASGASSSSNRRAAWMVISSVVKHTKLWQQPERC